MNEPKKIRRVQEIKKILLCRTDRLGDVILSLPCAVLLKRLFPLCNVTFLVQPYTAPVVRIFNSVDQVIEYEPKTSTKTLGQRLLTEQFDAAIALYPRFWLARSLKAASIQLRAGTAYRYYSLSFNYRHKEHRKENVKHEAEYNLSLTYSTFFNDGNWEKLLRPDELFPLNLKIPEAANHKITSIIGAAREIPRKVVIIHPGGSGSAHRWSIASFANLAKRFAKETNALILVTGIEEERALCEEVCQAAAGNCLNLCAKLSVVELAELLKQGDLLVTNSTGPLHLGRAVGAAVLGLFPSSPSMSPVRWGPYRQLERVITPHNYGEMRDISVESVLARARIILESGK